MAQLPAEARPESVDLGGPTIGSSLNLGDILSALGHEFRPLSAEELRATGLKDIRELRNIALGVAAALTGADTLAIAIHDKARSQASQVIAKYEQSATTLLPADTIKIPDSISPEQFRTTRSGYAGMRYLQLQEEGVSGVQEGMKPELLEAADRLVTASGDGKNSGLGELVFTIANSEASYYLGDEIGDMGRSLVTDTHIHKTISGIQESLTHGPLTQEHLNSLFSLIDHTGHAVAALVPGGAFTEKTVRSIIDLFRETPERVSQVLKQDVGAYLGTTEYIKSISDVHALVETLIAEHREEFGIPEGTNPQELASAIATRYILRHAREVYETDENARPLNEKYAPLAILTGMAAEFDVQQQGSLSLLRAGGVAK